MLRMPTLPVAVRTALAGAMLLCALNPAFAEGPARATSPARAPSKRPTTPAATPARSGRLAPPPAPRPIELAIQARALEEQGNYAAAVGVLKQLRGLQAPDADLELAIALDEARIGLADSAWARLRTPLMVAALGDTVGLGRRSDYPFQREPLWVNGQFDGWYWYVARARAELALQRRDWREALSMASRAANARPLSGKEALLLAVAAGRAGDARLAEAAAAWAAYLEPWLPEAHYLSGLWSWRNGRREEARGSLSTAAALDSSWRDPVLALARLRLPGMVPDSLPTRFLYGRRACGQLTSAKRPKQEEYVQFDAVPQLAFGPQTQPSDSLRAQLHLKKPTQLFLQVLVSERGTPLLVELPYVTEAQVPAAIVNHIVSVVGGWRFIAARRFDKPQRSWASVQYILQP